MLELVESLRSQNVSIWANNGKIKLAFGDNTPSETLVSSIKEHKSRILDFLNSHDIFSEDAFERFQIDGSFQNSREGGLSTPNEKSTNQIEAIFAANSLQQGFVVHHVANPDDDAYRVQLLLDYNKGIDLELYQEAWKLASIRYPILRMGFNWDDEILQVITSQPSINESNFKTIDLSDISKDDIDDKISEIQLQDRDIPFDLTKPGMIRFTVITSNERKVTVLKTEHHSIADGWGGAILLDTVHSYYNDLINGISPIIEVDQAYIETQSYHLNEKKNTQRYWSSKKTEFRHANDINNLLSCPVELNQIKTVTVPSEHSLTIGGSLYAGLKAQCQAQGITLNVALQFAWHKLLQYYTNDDQTVVGTTVSGRDIDVDGIESSVGLYINTLPLLVRWESKKTISEILQAIQLDIAALNSYSSVSLASLQQNEHRLFHSIFVFENYPVSECSANDTSKIEQSITFRQAVEKVDYPLCLTACEQNESLTISIKFSQAWLNTDLANRLLLQIQNVLQAIKEDPCVGHDTINLLSEEERFQTLFLWNDTEREYPHNKTISELFSEQVMKTPKKEALIFQNKSMTYEELDKQSNQLAHYILEAYQKEHGKRLGSDSLIALYYERSCSMVVSILAVLKVGAAYVPISTDDPQQRIDYILEDTGTSLLLTQDSLSNRLKNGLGTFAESIQVLTTDSLVELESFPSTAVSIVHKSTDLAYVIYTSGTTGQPKGVMVEHQGISSFVFNDGYVDASKVEKVASLSPYSFDGFVFDLFYPLLQGATCYLFEKDSLLDLSGFNQQICKCQIDTFFITTALFNQLVNTNTLQNTSVKNVLFGGETADLNTVDKARLDYPQINLTHVYGPTETIVFASACKIKERVIAAPIGKALDNKRLYVLDDNLMPVAVGAPGELYIGGAGLARGYLNQSQLTSSKFIDSPFATALDVANGFNRLYKTGDIVRWLADGNLAFIGRNDEQVKIRGHRIELGEIETALREIKGITQAVVTVREQSNNQCLAAYVVLESNDITTTHIRESLTKRLPTYLLPTTITSMDSIPFTVNGKIDKRSLPVPEFNDLDTYVPPRNELESKLCKIWQSILGVQSIGIFDNFFTLGGNSIAAIRLTAASRSELGLDIPLNLLFSLKTVAGLASHLGEQEMIVIPKSSLSQPPLSFAQERLLFIEKYENGSSTYHIPLLLELSDDVDLALLEKAFNVVLFRHPVMKTVYLCDENNKHFQRTLDDEIDINWESIPDEKMLHSLVKSKIETPFDLTCEPSIRVCGIKENANDYLLIVWHHIAFDGWSTDIFMQELGDVYQAFLRDETPNLPALDISYADYSAWQRAYLQGDTLDNLLGYWQQQLAGYESLNLPTDRARPAHIDYRGHDHLFSLDNDLSASLRALAKRQETTLYTLLLSGFYASLASLTGQRDILLGTPSDNRHHAQTQSLIGFFVNSLPLRAQVEPDTTVASLVSHVHEVVTQAKVHQELPFENLVDALQVERDPSRHPLYQVMFSVQSFGEALADASDLPFSPAELSSQKSVYSPAKFDLSLMLTDDQASIAGSINYAVSLFDESTIERLQAVFQRILRAFVADNQQTIGSIATVSDEERVTLLSDWNDTDSDYPDNQTLTQLFAAQVKRSPQKVALVYEGRELTYQQLDEQSNQLARALKAAYQQQAGESLKPDTLIGLYQDRSPEMLLSILAILKAGGAYVPISPDYPQSRVAYLLDDTKTSLVLTQAQYIERLTQWTSQQDQPASVLAVDRPDILAGYAKTRVPARHGPDDLAYVIYTSGTTGQPKGVLTPHRGVVSLVQDNDFINLSQADVMLHLSDPSFDAATFEIWGALTHGATLVIAPNTQELTSQALEQVITDNGLTVLWLTTALFESHYFQRPEMFASLRYLFIGGEVVTPEFIRRLVEQKNRPVQFINCYGPTESTTFTTTYECEAFSHSVPLGKPISTRKVYVLDEQGQLSGIGVPGELYIGGAGLARGYLNQAALTAEKFIDNPFASESDRAKGYTRLYRTGDMVRWLADGNLEFLGRNDDQIKIRGYRVELGEIENALCKIEGIQQAVVMVREQQSNQYLAAYYVGEETISSEVLRQQLSQTLPDYMLPMTYTVIESVPLTINGKLDKRALPEPILTSEEGYVAPRTELEAQLCEIWQSVLGIEQVGVHDNFFRIGGNSIMAIQLTEASRRAIGKEIPLALLFEQKTVAGLASHLSEQALEIIPVSGLAQPPLSFAQERLLFIERYEQGSSAYHIPILLSLKSDVDLNALEMALNVIIERHSALRTVYLTDEEDRNYQAVIEFDFKLQIENLESENALSNRLKQEIEKPFALNIEPSIRLQIYQLNQQQYISILWHHIGFDGWSTDLFINELGLAYQAIKAGKAPVLPALEISYADYSIWQRTYLQGDTLKKYTDYWKSQLTGFESLNLITDRSRPAQQDYTGNDLLFNLDVELSNSLREMAKRQETTLYTLMLSAFYSCLATLSGQSDVVVGTPSDNRHHAQTQSLIGFFVNSLALRCQIDPKSSVDELICQVHHLVSQAKIHQELPFENLVESLDIERDPSRHPIYQVMFSLQNFGESINVNNNLPFSPAELTGETGLFSPAKFDLSLFISDGHEEISGSFNYAVSLFDANTVERFLKLYKRILRSFVADNQQKIADIRTLSKLEETSIVFDWNKSDISSSTDKSLQQLFKAQVIDSPNTHAIYSDGTQYTYKKLDEHSDILARNIRALYRAETGQVLAPATPIGISSPINFSFVVSLLAVVKAGCTFLPISNSDSESTSLTQLQDASPLIILTDKKQSTRLNEYSVNANLDPLILDLGDESLYIDLCSEERLPSGNLDDLVCLFYSKAADDKNSKVGVNQRSIANQANYFAKRFSLNSSQKSLQFSSCQNESSIYELFCALLNGVQIFLCNMEQRSDFLELGKIIEQNKISFAVLPSLVLADVNSEQCTSLQTLLVTGDSFSYKVLDSFSTNCDVFTLYTAYDGSTAGVNLYEKGQNTGIIGQPVDGFSFYVLDSNDHLVPIGAPGELHIGRQSNEHDCLNNNYINEITLLDNTDFHRQYDGLGSIKLINTGDKVYWTDQGELIFINNSDRCAKIGDFNVDFLEVEHAINQLSCVKQAIVINVTDTGSEQLAAYVVANDAELLVAADLRKSLLTVLPEYSVPKSFSQLEYFPLTIDGSLDKPTLPKPLFSEYQKYTAPRNVLEQSLCDVWESIFVSEDKIGVHDNFFTLGGNSITAIRLTSACSRAIGREIPLALLFEQKTVAGLASHLSEQALEIIPVSGLAQPPLSFAQERLLFIERYEQGSNAYHVPLLLTLSHDIDLAALEEAINVIVERHPVLKTVYLTDSNDRNYQAILPQPVSLQSEVLTSDTQLSVCIEQAIASTFDLSCEPSIRLHHYQVAEADYLLIIWHHIAFDGWSMDIFINELRQAYQGLQVGEDLKLAALDISYADYSAWQRAYLQGDTLDNLLGYWQQQLAGYESLNLPTDRARPAHIDYRGHDHLFSLDNDLSASLRALAKRQETTLYTLLLSGFYASLASLTGQRDILLGTPSDNRHHAQTQSLIGFFVNSLPLRAQVEPDTTVASLVSHVHEVVTQAKVHQELPFENLVDALQVERDPSRHPLYQVMFSVQSFGEALADASDLPFSPAELSSQESVYSPAKFDLSLMLTDDQASIAGSINYAVSLFDESTIERLQAVFQRILRAFVADNQQTIGSIATVSDEERVTLLSDWNDTDSDYPDNQTLTQLFAAQVKRSPQKVALVYEGRELTYQQLDEQSNQLARALKAAYQQQAGESLKPDTLIGLYQDRSPEMLLSILAILKAGGAYVPISPDYPQSRVAYLLDDTKTSLVLTQAQYIERLTQWTSQQDQPASVLAVDRPDILAGYAKTRVPARHGPDDLAYVIYTSGTTGQPKGVLTPHRGVVSLVQDNDFINLSQADVMLHLSDPSFDAATFEIWGALTHGATLVIAPNTQELTSQALEQVITDNGLTVLWLTKTLFDNLYLQQPTMFASLNYLLVGGEALNPDLIRQLMSQVLRPTHILNGYGPTESTTFTTTYECEAFSHSVPLGKPISTRKVYVLDEQGQLSGIGVPGELYIGGAGLARGYLNQAALTAEKFIDNPFASESDRAKGYTRLYRTGDMVRWLADGNLEYLGRNDDQIKIRGYRVELGEIEDALCQIEGIQQAVVMVREQQSNQYLAAYYVGEETISSEVLRQQLSQTLPDYMLPMTYTVIESVPLTINGKLDKRALPEPILTSEEGYVAPRTELEAQLCEIWQSVLGIEQVGVHDNFFRIGGNSIMAIQLVNQCQRKFDIKLSVNLLFEKQTIAHLSEGTQLFTSNKANVLDEQYIKTTRGILDVRDSFLESYLELNDSTEIYPVTATQKNWLTHSFTHPGDESWWISTLLEIAPEIASQSSQSNLINAWQKVANTVPSLRSSFHFENNRVYQIVGEKLQIDIQDFTVSDLEECKRVLNNKLSDEFDITSNPLLRLFVFKTEDNKFYHALLIHHALIDGWSFSEVIARAYNSLMSVPYESETNTSSGQAYIEWQLNQDCKKANEYWKRELANLQCSIPFYVDKGFNKRKRNNVYQPEDALGAAESQRLYENARHIGVTPYIFIEAAWAKTLSKLGDRSEVFFTTLDSGRSVDVENINTLTFNTLNAIPARVTINQEDSSSALLGQLQQKLFERKSLSYVDISRAVHSFQREGFGSLLVYQNTELQDVHGKQASLGDQKSSIETPKPYIRIIDKYDPSPYKISLVINPNEQLSWFFEYFDTDIEPANFAQIINTFKSELKLLIQDTTVLQKRVMK
ncbi:non-ribosomal peptide synthetase [Aliiglaciecola sp. LCG003]|uniref:non-ribosomal peptide synthetase n=1 Tax=Aliiglaciecola sp. LCG003 TaxID=3053655 RepID=UPI0025743121|nr:non-ribosomal peptide synthetase [Aliiglaciecola sp. LCG003]WJG11186.1 amino acid adenylation domain-containing protein [Aliiglaciecola sp. LCG003]